MMVFVHTHKTHHQSSERNLQWTTFFSIFTVRDEWSRKLSITFFNHLMFHLFQMLYFIFLVNNSQHRKKWMNEWMWCMWESLERWRWWWCFWRWLMKMKRDKVREGKQASANQMNTWNELKTHREVKSEVKKHDRNSQLSLESWLKEDQADQIFHTFAHSHIIYILSASLRWSLNLTQLALNSITLCGGTVSWKCCGVLMMFDGVRSCLVSPKRRDMCYTTLLLLLMLHVDF